ncbi:MAG: hypothetical protein ACFE0J_25515 [Elainellaceae cyanobacterium]
MVSPGARELTHIQRPNAWAYGYTPRRFLPRYEFAQHGLIRYKHATPGITFGRSHVRDN